MTSLKIGSLVYVDNLLEKLKSKVKLFVDDPLLFSVVNCENSSASTQNNNDLMVIKDWTYNGKFHSTLITINKRKRSYFIEKQNQLLFHHYSLII